jgi:lipopolysaccharide transport system ATP-binding protein
MGQLAIRVEGLGKRYNVGENRPRYHTLRDSIGAAGLAPFRGVRSLLRGECGGHAQTFWALKDINFEVGRGEVIGIIGRNGAGKSTLLKVLSRITEPTEGGADVYGRVGSLLEVGTGFHPELTGRENIFLNGAILGMKRAEIARKFDEIVAFAEVERFIETPVKHYSSGMYLRLAFAVAAHLEPEILIVDEVLAVGDAAFQKKCIGKISSVAGEGRTVLFVSHDMTNISVLCDSALLLEGGRVKMRGAPAEVIGAYMRRGNSAQSAVAWNLDDAPGDGAARIVGVGVGEAGDGMDSLALQGAVPLTVEFVVLAGGVRVNPAFVVKNAFGTTVFTTANYEDPEWGAKEYGPGRYRSRCMVPPHVLNDGTYAVDALLVQDMRAVRASAEAAVSFRVHDDGTTRGDYVGEWAGIVRPRCAWTTQATGHVAAAAPGIDRRKP